ncbi:MAG: HDIG domain-containing protein [Chloroflexi bacterium]|nr:HDIG domain-containing protein [Chloroflexota bacterium]
MIDETVPKAQNIGGQDEHKGMRAVIRMILFGLCMWVALGAMLTFQFLPSRYQLNEGDVSPRDIKSPQKVTYVSQIKTKEERERAEAAVEDVFVQDATVFNQQKASISEVVRRISEIRREAATLQQRRDSVSKLFSPTLPQQTVEDILTLDEPTWRAVSAEAVLLLDLTMRERISDKQLADVKANLASRVDSQLATAPKLVVVALVQSHLKPNMALDAETTTKLRREAREKVPPVRLSVEKGETILRDGDIVKAVDVEKLEAAGLRNPNLQLHDITGTVLLVGVLIICLGYYVYFFSPQLRSNGRRLALLGFVLAVAVLAAKLTIPGREMYAYLFPVAAASMLISTLLGPQLAVVVTVLLSLLVGFIANFSLELTTLFAVSGLVGLLGARRMERMNAFFLTGLAVALANFTVIFAFELFNREPDPPRLLTLAFICAVNGALSAALTMGTFSFLGHIFGITTSLGLLELAQPTHQLFHRLMTDAPGTYHHSVVVANLAERAAQEVGADALLCRVSAYYHDIGKVMRPYFFIENQEGTNAHDRLDPKTSAQIIGSHVDDGLELARRHGLPSKVRDIIQQHHGTHIVAYFYQQACLNAGPAETIDQQAFRYSGPRPQTREAGIMMLADGVEAVVRASRDQSPERIAQLVQKIIGDRITDGQLDECDLTMRDLSQVREAFTTVLQGIFHPRIEYPDSVPKLAGPRALAVGRTGWIDE